MSLDCSITKLIKADFNTLWRCQHHGNTLEICTPYRMPDSTLFTLFLTQRNGRYIACDGGRIYDLIRRHSDLPEADSLSELRAIAQENEVKEGANDGVPLFFKDCTEQKLISSIAFDVANFAAMAANVILSIPVGDEETEKDKRFATEARQFISGIISSDQTLRSNYYFEDVPGIKFTAGIESASRIWIVSCITGTTMPVFRKNTSDAALNMKEAWRSRYSQQVKRMIPLLNNEAEGYNPTLLRLRFEELADDAKQEPVLWTERDRLPRLLAAA